MIMELDTALAIADNDKALAVAEQQLAALLAEDPNLLDMWGGENLEEGDTGQPPRLRICQRTTDVENVEQGHYFNTLTGESWATLEVVPLLPLGPTYAEYFKPFKRGEPPFCASDDGKMPRESTERRPLQRRRTGPCADCPAKDFGPNGEPPDCTRQRNFMLMNRASGEMLHLSWERSANKKAKQLTAIMKGAGIRKSVILTTIDTKNEKGTYFVPAVLGGDLLPADELVRVIQARAEVNRLIASGDIQIVADEDVDLADNGNGGATSHTTTVDSPFTEEAIPF
jgi:hypothetical protein